MKIVRIPPHNRQLQQIRRWNEGNEWQPGLHNGSNGNYSLMADEIELWEEQKAGKCMIQQSSS